MAETVLSRMHTTLRVDAMFFHTAQDRAKQFERLAKRIRDAESRVNRLQAKWDDLAARCEDDGRDRYPQQERVAIQLENEEYTLGSAYGPVLRRSAEIHVLCACALEAHINDRAKSTLPAWEWERFEPLALDGKWILLPRLLGKKTFDPGAEPFQGLARLVKLRNLLVHYKPRRERTPPRGVPTFLAKLGLTASDADRSINAVIAIVSALAQTLGHETPSWVRVHGGSYFDVEFVKNSA